MTAAALDVYTPWRDTGEALLARHVGRAAELTAVTDSLRAFARGRGSPLPLFLFGPRGAGKSHLLSLAQHQARPDLDAAGIRLLHVPEDISVLGTANELLQRMAGAARPPSWKRWTRASPRGEELPPAGAVVFIEGLDRHLEHMKEDERRNLRRAIEESRLYVVATGCVLPSALTSRDSAFYGAFQVHPLLPLGSTEAEQLLDRVAGDEATRLSQWNARRSALVLLAGGSPRTLVALGGACSAAPEAWAADHLHTVLRQFTAHYQMRFRDLAPQAQTALEILTAAPWELTPTDIGGSTGWSASQASTVLNRLRDDGVLSSRAVGRSSYFRLSEPLFRHWYEYRNSPWEETRVGWLSRLIEAVLTSSELAEALVSIPDAGIQEAVRGVVRRGTPRGRQVRTLLTHRIDDRLARDDDDGAAGLLDKWEGGPSDGHELYLLSMASRETHPHFRAALSSRLGDAAVLFQSMWEFESRIRAGAPPREAFSQALRQAAPATETGGRAWRWASPILLTALEDVPERRGQPWTLDPGERRLLARMPVLRVAFLERGKLPSHSALLAEEDVRSALHGSPHPLDWPGLLQAAIRVRALALAAALVATGAGPAAFTLPFHPRPGAVLLGSSPEFAVLADRTGRRYPARLASWGAECAALSDEDWDRLLRKWIAARDRELPMATVERSQAESGLAALGLRRPERLQQLLDAAPPGELQHLAERAMLLVGQLESPTGRAPQLELAGLRGLLLPPGSARR